MVDDELRVLGVEGLAVADSSVFPVQISNNPNLTCYMIGERFAMRLAGAPDAQPQEPAQAPAGA